MRIYLCSTVVSFGLHAVAAFDESGKLLMMRSTNSTHGTNLARIQTFAGVMPEAQEYAILTKASAQHVIPVLRGALRTYMGKEEAPKQVNLSKCKIAQVTMFRNVVELLAEHTSLRYTTPATK